MYIYTHVALSSFQFPVCNISTYGNKKADKKSFGLLRIPELQLAVDPLGGSLKKVCMTKLFRISIQTFLSYKLFFQTATQRIYGQMKFMNS